jgi:hypothetical protein
MSSSRRAASDPTRSSTLSVQAPRVSPSQRVLPNSQSVGKTLPARIPFPSETFGKRLEGFAKKCGVPGFWQNTPQRMQAGEKRRESLPFRWCAPSDQAASEKRMKKRRGKHEMYRACRCSGRGERAIGRVDLGGNPLPVSAGCHLKPRRWQTLSHLHIPLVNNHLRPSCNPRLPTSQGASGGFFLDVLKPVGFVGGIGRSKSALHRAAHTISLSCIPTRDLIIPLPLGPPGRTSACRSGGRTGRGRRPG